jgi:hypothetical protein
MAGSSDIPPAHTAKPVDPPPPSDNPTSAMLKADIESGRTGDKVGVRDPGLSSLGTDDEAAGRPPSPFRIALARYQETIERWSKGRRRARDVDHNWNGALAGFLGMIVAIGLVLLIAIWLGSR